jgi:hypothetical protein
MIELAEHRNRNDLGLVGRALAAVQRLNRIVEARKCSRRVALEELATSSVVDPQIMRAMTAAISDGRRMRWAGRSNEDA